MSLVFNPFKILYWLPFSRDWAIQTFTNSEVWVIGPKWWHFFKSRSYSMDLLLIKNPNSDEPIAKEIHYDNVFDWMYKDFSLRKDIMPQMSGFVQVKALAVKVPTSVDEQEQTRRLKAYAPLLQIREYKYVPMLRITLTTKSDFVKLGLILK